MKRSKGGSKKLPQSKPNLPKVPSKTKFPPIIAAVFNVKDFVSILTELNVKNFRYNVNLKTSRTTIYAGDRPTFDTISTVLRNNSIQFFTQLFTDERRTNLIVKGVPVGFDVNDVIEDVKIFNLNDKIKVVPLKEGNRASFTYYILSLAPGVDHKPLLGEHRLFLTKLRIEKFHRNSRVL